MPVNLTWLTLLQHMANSLLPWLVVLVVGGGIGFLIARGIHRWAECHPAGRLGLLLIPWRSAAILFAFLVLNSALWSWNFFIPSHFMINNNGLTLMVLFVPWLIHTFLNFHFPKGAWIQVLAVIRTFSIISLVIPVFLQTEGLGHFIFMAAYWFDLTKMKTGYAVLFGMMLSLDLIIGAIQFTLARKKTPATA
jgi:hypothetical protein